MISSCADSMLSNIQCSTHCVAGVLMTVGSSARRNVLHNPLSSSVQTPFDFIFPMPRSTSVSESGIMVSSRKNIPGMVRRTRPKNATTRPQPSRTREKRPREIPVVNGDENDDQEESTFNVKVPANEYNAQRLEASAEPPYVQRDVEKVDEPALHHYNMLDDGTSDLSPGDPITSRRTLDFVEDLLTPLQSTPKETVYETTANAWDYRAAQQQPDESSSATSPGLQKVFDEWLAPLAPEQASHDLEAMSEHSGKS